MLTEAEVRKECIKYITDSKDSTTAQSQTDRMKLSQDFFRGGKKQWTQEEYDIYKSRGVEPVTINRCKPVVKGLIGMYLQNRQCVKVRPRRNGTGTVAGVWTELIKHTQDLSYADYIYACLFLRGSIDTEAYLKLEIDKAENINGQPKIVVKGLSEIIVDRNALEYNLDDSAQYVIEKDWKQKEIIEALYPDRDEKIKEGINSLDDDSISDRIVNNMANWMAGDGDIDHYDEDESEADYEKLKQYRYLIHRVFWKEVVPALIVVDTQERQLKIVTDEKLVWKLRRKAKKNTRFEITNHAAKILHETVMLGSTLLEDIKEPLGEGISRYPIVRYSPIWDIGYAIGALDDVISLNREENIHRTQNIRLLNQTANSGWLIGSDNNKKYVAELKNFGSVEGIVIPKDKFGGFVEKIKANPLDQGRYAMAAQFEQDVKRVSGVDDAIHGYNTGKVESGIAIGRKQEGSKISNDTYFDNLYRTLEIFGNLLLDVVMNGDYYTDEEIVEIVGESGLMDARMLEKSHGMLIGKLRTGLRRPTIPAPLDPNMMMAIRPEDQPGVLDQVRQGAEAAQRYAEQYPRLKAVWDDEIKFNAAQMLLSELRSDTTGKYGVKVTVSPSSPTERLSRLAELEAIQDKYGIIPPDIFIDATDIPSVQKEEIKNRMQQQAQLQAQAGAG